MHATASPPQPDPILNQPIYWFALLDRAIAQGDHDAAAESQRQLARLGVRVSYGRPRRSVRQGDPHAS
jgi:hypothetical protein